MSPVLVLSCYGSALLVSVYLLWHFGQLRWYWHALSVCIALAIGFYPGNEFLGRPDVTLATGWIFTALFVWGAGGAAFPIREHAHRHGDLTHHRV